MTATAAEKVRTLLSRLGPDACVSVPAGTLRELLEERDGLAAERLLLMTWLEELGYDAPYTEQRLRKLTSGPSVPQEGA